jgi:hypothetical protein
MPQNYISTLYRVCGKTKTCRKHFEGEKTMACIIREVGQKPTSFDDVHFFDWKLQLYRFYRRSYLSRTRNLQATAVL